jgi:hypothetical protein
MGRKLIRDLEQALVGLEVGWQGGARAFSAAVDATPSFTGTTCARKSRSCCRSAERFLTAEDWREIDAAFAGNSDPIADLREQDFEKLFSRIVTLAPEPSAWASAGRRRRTPERAPYRLNRLRGIELRRRAQLLVELLLPLRERFRDDDVEHGVEVARRRRPASAAPCRRGAASGRLSLRAEPSC